MGDTRKRIIADLIIGLVMAVALAFLTDVFHAESKSDLYRLLSDCFFLPAVILLASAGLTWTKNGGVWDGLVFSMKTMMSRMTRRYEDDCVTFAEYREKREEKASSPIPSLIAGAVYLVLAMVFLALYNRIN